MGAPRRSVDGPYGTPVPDDAGGTRRLDPAVSLPGAEAVDPDDPALGPDADPEAVARAIVLRKLTAAPRTRAQLADDLRRRAVPEEVAVRVLDRFTEVGLVDDALYAQTWVRSRHAGRGLARRALRHELRTRGVDEVTIAEAVDAVSADDEAQAARALVRRRLAATRALPRDARIRRLAGQLARKGYPGGLALHVVRDEISRDEATHGRGGSVPTGADDDGADLGF